MFFLTKQPIEYPLLTKPKGYAVMKKSMMFIAVAAALSACGGGGGSGSPSTASTNTATGNSRPPVVSQPVDNGTASNPIPSSNPKAGVRPVLPSQLNAQDAADYAAHTSGRGGSIISVDSGVDVNNPLLKGRNISPTMTVIANYSQYEAPTHVSQVKSEQPYHGTRMAATAFETRPQVRVDVVGTKDGTSVYEAVHGMESYLKNNKDKFGKTVIIANAYSNGYSSENLKDNRYRSFTGAWEKAITGSDEKPAALWVVAAGNDTHPHPHDTSMLPLFNDKLAGSNAPNSGAWLTVSSTNPDTNRCGIVGENNCITAPDGFSVADKGGKKTPVLGTSPATYVVASHAAAVLSRYDWASPYVLKQVLLTTADKKANTPYYGAGIVNGERALKGLGAVNGTLDLHVNGKKSMYFFGNNIGGTGTLNKYGADTLVFTGKDNTFGKLNVKEGTAVANGNMPEIGIDAGAKFAVGDYQGSQSLIRTGSIHNDGTLSAETNNDLLVNGNLTGKGTLNKTIGSTVVVTGNAHLGGMNVTGINKGYVTKEGKREVLLAAEKVSGLHSGNVRVANNVRSLIQSTPHIGSNSVSVVTTRESVGDTIARMEKVDGLAEDGKVLENTLNVLDKQTPTGETLRFAARAVNGDVGRVLFANGASTLSRSLAFGQNLAARAGNDMLDAAANKGTGAFLDVRRDQTKPEIAGLSASNHNHRITIGGVWKTPQGSAAASVFAEDRDWNESYMGLAKKVDSSAYGVQFAHILPFGNGWHLLSNSAYARLGVKNGADKANGNQFQFGLGVAKNMPTRYAFLRPSFTVQNVYSEIGGMKQSENMKTLSSKVFTTTAKGGLEAYIPYRNFLFKGAAGVEQDIGGKVKNRVSLAGVESRHSYKAGDKTRFNADVGVSYKFGENTSLNAGYRFTGSKNQKSHTANIGLDVKF